MVHRPLDKISRTNRTLRLDAHEIRATNILLVERAKNNDIDALDKLLSSHHQSATRLANKILKNSDAAGDALQNARILAFKNIHRLNDHSNFKAYYMRIVHNAAIQIARSMNNEKHVATDEYDYFASNNPLIDDTLFLQEILKILKDNLDEESFKYINLADVEHITYKEISEMLDTPEGTTKSRIHRARQTAKSILTANGYAQYK